MTIAAAHRFIQHAVTNPELISKINRAPDNAAILEILSEMEMVFNYEQFEMAYYNMLTWCRTPQQAASVKEVKLWWDCLGYYIECSTEQVPKDS